MRFNKRKFTEYCIEKISFLAEERFLVPHVDLEQGWITFGRHNEDMQNFFRIRFGEVKNGEIIFIDATGIIGNEAVEKIIMSGGINSLVRSPYQKEILLKVDENFMKRRKEIMYEVKNITLVTKKGQLRVENIDKVLEKCEILFWQEIIPFFESVKSLKDIREKVLTDLPNDKVFKYMGFPPLIKKLVVLGLDCEEEYKKEKDEILLKMQEWANIAPENSNRKEQNKALIRIYHIICDLLDQRTKQPL
jgi:hypothetical protein